ncbi:uncharacterized protein LOC123540379 [Mercenaria mercenaria]|uniref:uncharacterized protein LOC123540379 n=1 Tax=Mercenaria mercenaria TaxID=6596 RepID=UPI001E1DD053|nr:uncharacterized protein LOC123540379 [Mercenaria mercenaria]
MSKGKCGKDTYFGPLGKCQNCGELCDRPALYPQSCGIYCPDYAPKDRTTTTLFPSIPPSQPTNSIKPLLIGGFTSLGALLFLSFILCWLWKKILSKRFSRIVEKRRNKKLRVSVQVQSSQNECPESVALNSSGETIDDIGELENDVMNSSDDLETNEHRLLTETERSDSTHTVITITDEISHYSTNDFEFGETLPFHSLSSLESLFEYSGDQTHRKMRSKSS